MDFVELVVKIWINYFRVYTPIPYCLEQTYNSFEYAMEKFPSNN